VKNTRQLFETALYSEDHHVALTVVSVPTEHLPDGERLASSPASVLSALRLRPVAEVPPQYLSDALTAILVTNDADEAAQWLVETPDPAPVELGDDVKALKARWISDDRAPSDVLVIERSRTSVAKSPPHHRPRKVPKEKAKEELREFTRDVANDSLVPFQKSPIDLYQISDLLRAGEAMRTFVVTVQSNPIVLVWLSSGGFLIASAVRGTGRGLSAGLQYRLLKHFGVPDDIVRDQMRRGRREQ
jgi:hypothetical protein